MSATVPLPVAWDGHPVEWGPWEPEMPVFICGRARTAAPCPECGLIRPRAYAAGTVTIATTASTIGRARLGGDTATIRRRLQAWRCTACGHDTVVDWDLEVWELDMTDYGPDGSWSVEGGT